MLEHGDEDDIVWLFREFSPLQIEQVLRTTRRLSPRFANFWALISQLGAGDVAALSE